MPSSIYKLIAPFKKLYCFILFIIESIIDYFSFFELLNYPVKKCLSIKPNLLSLIQRESLEFAIGAFFHKYIVYALIHLGKNLINTPYFPTETNKIHRKIIQIRKKNKGNRAENGQNRAGNEGNRMGNEPFSRAKGSFPARNRLILLRICSLPSRKGAFPTQKRTIPLRNCPFLLSIYFLSV